MLNQNAMSTINKNPNERFFRKHPILLHLLLIMAACVVLLIASQIAMNIFTEHGKTHTVPAVNGMPLREAVTLLESSGFRCEVADSIFSDNVPHGAVVDQNPKPGTEVKSNRTIYLIVNPINPRTIALPQVKEISERQGRSLLEGVGFKNVQIMTVPSHYEGLILSVTVNGREIEAGTRLQPNTLIVLQVGDGTYFTPVDSLNPDEQGGGILDPTLM